MNEKFAKALRHHLSSVRNPMERLKAERLLRMAYRAADHRERGAMRQMFLR